MEFMAVFLLFAVHWGICTVIARDLPDKKYHVPEVEAGNDLIAKGAYSYQRIASADIFRTRAVNRRALAGRSMNEPC